MAGKPVPDRRAALAKSSQLAPAAAAIVATGRGTHAPVSQLGRDGHRAAAGVFTPQSESEIAAILQARGAGRSRQGRQAGTRGLTSPAPMATCCSLMPWRRCGASICSARRSRCRRAFACIALISAMHRHGMTLPVIGSVTQQSIAGAIATGTARQRTGTWQPGQPHRRHALGAGEWRSPADQPSRKCPSVTGGARPLWGAWGDQRSNPRDRARLSLA